MLAFPLLLQRFPAFRPEAQTRVETPETPISLAPQGGLKPIANTPKPIAEANAESIPSPVSGQSAAATGQIQVKAKRIVSELTRQRMAEAKRGRKLSGEVKAKISESMRGKPATRKFDRIVNGVDWLRLPHHLRHSPEQSHRLNEWRPLILPFEGTMSYPFYTHFPNAPLVDLKGEDGAALFFDLARFLKTPHSGGDMSIPGVAIRDEFECLECIVAGVDYGKQLLHIDGWYKLRGVDPLELPRMEAELMIGRPRKRRNLSSGVFEVWCMDTPPGTPSIFQICLLYRIDGD
jgi:hypothetical protein